MPSPIQGSRMIFQFNMSVLNIPEEDIEEAENLDISPDATVTPPTLIPLKEDFNAVQSLVTMYWKRGVGEFFNQTALNILEIPVATHKIYTISINSSGAPQVNTSFTQNKPGGRSFRQQSIKVIFKTPQPISNYSPMGVVTSVDYNTVSLAYNKRYNIKMAEWYNWLLNDSGQGSNIRAVVSPDGVSWPFP